MVGDDSRKEKQNKQINNAAAACAASIAFKFYLSKTRADDEGAATPASPLHPATNKSASITSCSAPRCAPIVATRSEKTTPHIRLESPIDREAWCLSGDAGANGWIAEEREEPHKEQGKRRYSQRACDANEQIGHRIAPQR
jgi:hypothetical protein